MVHVRVYDAWSKRRGQKILGKPVRVVGIKTHVVREMEYTGIHCEAWSKHGRTGSNRSGESMPMLQGFAIFACGSTRRRLCSHVAFIICGQWSLVGS